MNLLRLAAVAALLAPALARADFHTRSPNEIDWHEFEIEHNGSTTFDRHDDKADQRSYTAEFGVGVTDWWHPELELGIERDGGPDQPTRITEGVFENTIRLTESGEGWVDVGFYAEYAFGLRHGSADSVEFGPLFQKDIGRTTHTLNLLLTKGVGSVQDDHGFDFSYAWQSRWNIWRLLSPAIEVYGDAGAIDHVDPFKQQQLIVGPVAVGTLFLGNSLGKFKYEAGYLFGATNASPSGTLRWKAEIEVPF